MRDCDKNLHQAQSAPEADVLPTKQAEIPYKRIAASLLLRSGFSKFPMPYLVEIRGTDGNTKQRTVRPYEEYHPLMAVGRAVTEFRMESLGYSIDHVFVSRRVEKSSDAQ